ncbi:amidohydrolase [Seongchinamella sediminis]|uniref:Amidohydrolase n=1 Tax=Seongchinamella sediminis TaxID=2283635 RepID=A0A3L7DY93_9GAMM|nr:amidohydrolase family protein [Seongchinamella sediminis]RLQ22568.1 amidohydrolase [Seongchinamella sediminis]
MKDKLVISLCTAALVAAAPLAVAAGSGDKGWDVNRPDFSAQPGSVRVDVTEGTWMSLDVSPDGSTIAFDLLGDIYTLPITGGEASPVTSGLAWDIQPRFSPDGSELAFISDRAGGDNVWLLDLASGEPRQLTFERFRLLNNPSWSPDGQFIAARKHYTTSRSLGTGEIWLYHVDGGEQQTGQRVVERPSETFQKEQGEPMFTADGSGIYFTRNVTPGDTFIYHQDSNTELFQIRRVNLADGSIDTVAGGPGGAVRPTPSPDGKQLAYVKRVRARSRLFVMDLASGEERMLFDALDLDMQETWAVHGLYPNMDWTPDSRHLVFWAQGKIWKIAAAGGEPEEIPFRVQDSRELYPPIQFPVEVAPDEFNTRMVRFARRSPDGAAVVFESLGELYIKRGDRAPQPLDSDSGDGFDYSPVWSPDGKHVYFLRWQDRNLTSVRRVSARGGRSKGLPVPAGQYSELAIAASGEELLLRKLAANALLGRKHAIQPGIYLHHIGRESTRFVSQRGQQPHFGPDGRIYAHERAESATGRGSQTAKTLLISMTREGNDVREVAQSELATSIQLSPDGKHIAFTDSHQVYLLPVISTGSPLILDGESAGFKTAFPKKRLSDIGGTFMHWSADGNSVSWSTGPVLKTVSVAAAMQAGDAPERLVSDLSMPVEADIPESSIALTNARIITMNAAREVIDKGTILVRGNRIEQLGNAADIVIPDNYRVVDLSGKTITPGFVDIHAHGPYGQGEIIPQQNWDLLAHLALGVTTVHNPASKATQAFAAAEYLRAGKILGPRIFSTGETIYGARSTGLSPVDSLDDALGHVRRLKAQGAITVKNYNQPRREQRQQINEAARREGMMAVAEGGALYHQDMNLLADGITGIEHNVPTLNMYDDVHQYWQQSGAGYTPTLVVTFGGLTSEDYFYQHTEVWKHPILSRFVPPTVLQSRAVRRPMAPESDYRDNEAAAAAKELLDLGINVNIGAHGQREGLAAHWEMWSFARGGFSPMEALATATINPARYLSMDADIGSLEAHKLADLVILDRNPLEDIRNSDQISHIMANGRLYEAATLRQVHTGDSELAPFYWQGTPRSGIF